MIRVRVGDEGFRIASVGLQAGNAEGKFIKIRASRFKKVKGQRPGTGEIPVRLPDIFLGVFPHFPDHRMQHPPQKLRRLSHVRSLLKSKLTFQEGAHISSRLSTFLSFLTFFCRSSHLMTLLPLAVALSGANTHDINLLDDAFL